MIAFVSRPFDDPGHWEEADVAHGIEIVLQHLWLHGVPGFPDGHRPPAERLGALRVLEGDTVSGDEITGDIRGRIEVADLVVLVDRGAGGTWQSGGKRGPPVYDGQGRRKLLPTWWCMQEVGYAHGLGRPVLGFVSQRLDLDALRRLYGNQGVTVVPTTSDLWERLRALGTRRRTAGTRGTTPVSPSPASTVPGRRRTGAGMPSPAPPAANGTEAREVAALGEDPDISGLFRSLVRRAESLPAAGPVPPAVEWTMALVAPVALITAAVATLIGLESALRWPADLTEQTRSPSLREVIDFSATCGRWAHVVVLPVVCAALGAYRLHLSHVATPRGEHPSPVVWLRASAHRAELAFRAVFGEGAQGVDKPMAGAVARLLLLVELTLYAMWAAYAVRFLAVDALCAGRPGTGCSVPPVPGGDPRYRPFLSLGWGYSDEGVPVDFVRDTYTLLLLFGAVCLLLAYSRMRHARHQPVSFAAAFVLPAMVAVVTWLPRLVVANLPEPDGTLPDLALTILTNWAVHGPADLLLFVALCLVASRLELTLLDGERWLPIAILVYAVIQATASFARVEYDVLEGGVIWLALGGKLAIAYGFLHPAVTGRLGWFLQELDRLETRTDGAFSRWRVGAAALAVEPRRRNGVLPPS